MLSFEQKIWRKIKRAKTKRRQIEFDGRREIEPNLKAISDALDEFYFTEKMKVYCAYLSYSQMVNPKGIHYDLSGFRLLREVLEASKDETLENPCLEIYRGIQQLYEQLGNASEDLDEVYLNTEKLIQQYTTSFSADERAGLYSYLSNYCIRRINEGEKKYLARHFVINNEILNLQYGKKKNKDIPLPGSVFKNMIVTALRIKESTVFINLQTKGLRHSGVAGFKDAFDWVDQFIEVYKNRLGPKNYPFFYPYCQALVEFERKEFKKAYEILANPARVKGLFTNMQIRKLHLQIIFEIYQKTPEVLERDKVTIEKVLESYRGLLRDERERKKQQFYQQNFFLCFEKLYRMIYLFYNRYEGQMYNGKNEIFVQEKIKIETEIKNNNYSYCSWLLEKLENIK